MWIPGNGCGGKARRRRPDSRIPPVAAVAVGPLNDLLGHLCCPGNATGPDGEVIGCGAALDVGFEVRNHTLMLQVRCATQRTLKNSVCTWCKTTNLGGNDRVNLAVDDRRGGHAVSTTEADDIIMIACASAFLD